MELNVICPYCSKEAEWVENTVIYGRRYGKSYMIWYCAKCDAYVGCHQNTRKPLGTMANRELRVWRQKTHRAIDPFWKSGQMPRKELYRILSEKMGFRVHVAESDIETCKQIIAIAKEM